MKIYVASSWRNQHHADTVRHLRCMGHEVYNFKNPPHGRGGFAWSSIDPLWEKWTPEQWRAALTHPLAVDGFKSDLAGMEWADVCVLVLPCGRSAHLEAGWFAGKGKPVAFLALEPTEPDLMVGLGNGILTSYGELTDWVLGLEWQMAVATDIENLARASSSAPLGRGNSEAGTRGAEPPLATIVRPAGAETPEVNPGAWTPDATS